MFNDASKVPVASSWVAAPSSHAGLFAESSPDLPMSHFQDESMNIIEKWRPKLEGSGILVVIGGHKSSSPRGGE